MDDAGGTWLVMMVIFIMLDWWIAREGSAG